MSKKTIHSIQIYECSNGYYFSFYNRQAECIARFIYGWGSIDNGGWSIDGDDISEFEVDSGVHMTFTSNEGNERADYVKKIWRERSFSDEHYTLWVKERDSYLEYRDSDDQWSSYGWTNFYTVSPEKFRDVLDQYRDASIITKGAELYRQEVLKRWPKLMKKYIETDHAIYDLLNSL